MLLLIGFIDNLPAAHGVTPQNNFPINNKDISALHALPLVYPAPVSGGAVWYIESVSGQHIFWLIGLKEYQRPGFVQLSLL